ncbi:hypothetical protein [Moorena producens]|nr:hypothetical protein [Moorena producens]
MHPLLFLPYFLFPIPCSLFPIPFLYQSYLYISNRNTIAFVFEM